jgi:hypothetical protein
MNLHYLVAEISNNGSYVFDSRTNHKTEINVESNQKRQLIVEYCKLHELANIVSIYEVALPSSRTQVICWYQHQ